MQRFDENKNGKLDEEERDNIRNFLSRSRNAEGVETTKRDDKIHIPTFSQEIFVLGEVLTPGARLYQNDLSASDYIEQSGGLGLYGDKERIVVISPNGDSYLWTGGVFALSRSKFDSW